MFEARNVERYARQALIAEYEDRNRANLIVVVDEIFASSMTYVEELLTDVDRRRPLHVLLASPGGDGETALRMVSAFHGRCSELTILVPDMAKSAGTLICLGAHRIVMGPGGDLGPVDPQFPASGNTLLGARDIIAAVDEAVSAASRSPDTVALYSSLLSDVSLVMVGEARNAVRRSRSIVESILSCGDRLSQDQIAELTASLSGPLIDDSASHGTTISADEAIKMGLPVIRADPLSDQWRRVWTLWTRYYALGCYPSGSIGVYEGRRASLVRE